jgi:hypothetical protein
MVFFPPIAPWQENIFVAFFGDQARLRRAIADVIAAGGVISASLIVRVFE